MAGNDATIKIGADTSQATKALGDLNSSLKALAGITIGTQLVKDLVEIIGKTQEMTNKLISVSSGLEEANSKFYSLANVAKSTGASLGGTVDLFQKVSMASSLAGTNTAGFEQIVSNVNKTLVLSGASAEGARSVLYNLAQAFSNGTLQGNDFRAILENDRVMVDLLSKSLNKSTAELRVMAENGELTMDKVAKAIFNAEGLADKFGKTIKTIPQAMNNLETSISVAVKKFDEMTHAGELIVTVINFIANNIEGIAIVALGALTAAFFALDIAISPVVLIVGAVGLAIAGLGFIVQKTIDFFRSGINVFDAFITTLDNMGAAAAKALGINYQLGKTAEETNKKIVEGDKAVTDSGKAVLVTNDERTKQALALDKALKEHIDSLRTTTAIEAKGTGIKDLQLEVEKAIGAEQVKYRKIKQEMLKEDVDALSTATRNKILTDETLQTKKKQLDLDSSIGVARIQDYGQQQVSSQLESYRLGVTKETYEANKGILESKIRENLQSQLQSSLNKDLKSSQLDLNSLIYKDLDAREIELEVSKKRLEQGILFTSESEKTLRATLANNQAMQNALETEKQLNLLRGNATPQKRSEQIATATGVIASSDPRLGLAQDYATKKAAIDKTISDNEIGLLKLSQSEFQTLLNARTNLEIEYRNAKELADIEYDNKELFRAQAQSQALIDLQSKVFEAKKLAEIQAATGTQFGYETQKAMAKEGADFEKKSTLEKTQFGIEQAANMFSSLGQQNRQAFEASKALNIGMAIMNTYMGATKALATYPWPFGLIAAAAAVAAGMAQVSAIRSQQYTGRASGGPVAGNTPYIVGERGPELFVPNGGGTIMPNNQMGGSQSTTVNFNITANDTAGFDELLMKRRGLITQVIRDAQMERGQRLGA